MSVMPKQKNRPNKPAIGFIQAPARKDAPAPEAASVPAPPRVAAPALAGDIAGVVAAPAPDECEPVRVVMRQQWSMAAAMTYISHLTANLPPDACEKDKEALRKTYGGLCHSFPILVRQNGLCQALAFVGDKKSGEESNRKRAYAELWNHISATLNLPPGTDLLTHVQTAPVGVYLHDTRVLLDAWIFYKRFAASLLGVTGPEVVEP